MALATLLLLQSCSKGQAPGGAPPGASDAPVTAPARDPRSTGATRDYGDLYVVPTSVETYASVQPWTSYWFPAKDPILWQPQPDGTLAPLQKYDLYMQTVHGQTTTAAQWEEADFQDDNADNWDGLCDAWSAASILIQPEPATPVTLNGIFFDIVDLKALVVKSFQDMNGKKKIYGYKYTQEGIDDFQDIYPDQFHRVLVAELINKGNAFVIDKDPGIEVWNTPIAGVMMTIVSDPTNAHVMHVSTRLQYAEYSDSNVDAVGTNSTGWILPIPTISSETPRPTAVSRSNTAFGRAIRSTCIRISRSCSRTRTTFPIARASTLRSARRSSTRS